MISRGKYERIEKEYLLQPSTRRPPPRRPVLKLGGNAAPTSLPVSVRRTTRTRRRSWRMPRLKTVRLFLSPKSLLRRMRDAYVNLMVSFTNKRGHLGLISNSKLRNISAFGNSAKIQISNKDLQRLYMAYLQRTEAEVSDRK